MQPVIEAADLTKRYGSVRGIEGVSFTVEPGEVFGFLGPNGAGKTTTIRLLVQLLQPDSGSLRLFGEDTRSHQPELRERIGYLPGDFQPYPEMKAGRFLRYMASYRKRPSVLTEYLGDMLRLSPKDLNRPIKHLSHGNKQKVGLMLALAHEPDLAILDEPTLGLDPLMQDVFYEIVRELRSRGKTIFLSSHQLSEVEKVCDRVAIVRDGRLVALESLDALKRRRPRRLIVSWADPALEAPDILRAEFTKAEGGRSIYRFEGDPRELVRALDGLPVREFYLPEPDLEDVFLAYYREGQPS